jgi:hypothetical protein
VNKQIDEAAKKFADKMRRMILHGTPEETWGICHAAFFAGAKFMAKLKRPRSDKR